jgi:hypothetical protein
VGPWREPDYLRILTRAGARTRKLPSSIPTTATSIHIWSVGPEPPPNVTVGGSVCVVLEPSWLLVNDSLEDELDEELELEDEDDEELELEDEDDEELELEDELDELDEELELFEVVVLDEELELDEDCWPSEQFSEYVLLDEMAVPSSLTANTPRIPPCVSVNAFVTETVQSTWVPEARPPTSRVTSFFATLASGLASEPLFGTK